MELILIEGAHPFVDESFYLNANPNVQSDVNAGLFNSGLEHFVLVGAGAGLHPVEGMDIAYFLTSNSDNYIGDNRAEMILGLESSDSILGLDGNDRINGNQDNDTVNGNVGDDTVRGGKGDDIIYGGQNNDQLFGDLGDDTVWGDRGDDTVFGGDGQDYLFGLLGNDRLSGDIGQDTINGNQGQDTIDGGEDNDSLYGGQDNDRLLGNTGNDTLFGDQGADTLSGGDGQDFFAIGLGTGGPEIFDADVITDFRKNEDTIQLLDGLTFEELNIFAGTGDNAGNTIIQHQSTGEYLAIVNGINPGQLDENDFTPKTIDPPVVFNDPEQFVCDAISGVCYFVDPNGDDTGAGNARSPFKTIQKAADIAQPGDKVYIRGGTYRENVVPKNSGTPDRPITFAAFKNEEVIISGTDPITDWTQHDGNIYKASLSELTDLGSGQNQIFVNGEMMTEARWPNIPGDPTSLTRADNAIADSGDVVSGSPGNRATGSYTDSDLAAANFADNFWQGAKINFLPGWNWSTQTGEVVSNQGGEVQFDFNWQAASAFNNEPYKPQAENGYYLWGKYEALDTPKEWYYDAPTDSLYLWSPNGADPDNSTVEVKQREYAFRMFNKSDIHLENINVFGAAIQVFESDRVILDGIESKYGAHTQVLEDPFQFSLPSVNFSRSTNSELKNSYVAYSAGSAVNIGQGSGNKVTNSVIHNVGYMGTHGSAVEVTSEQPEVTNNTLFNSGSRLINLLESAQGNISENEVYNGGLQASDFGGIIAFENSGENTTIANNSIHDINALYDPDLNYFGSAGIILEKADNFLVQNNLIYNTSIDGFKYFDVSGANPVNLQLVNNTIDGEILLNPRGNNRILGSTLQNNIYRGINPNSDTSDITFENNLSTSNFDNLFADLPNRDYRPLAGSDAIGKGAFELEQEPWLAGATLLQTDLPALQIQFDEPVNGTLSGQITGLPIGRKLPTDFQLIIGEAEPSGNFESSYFDPITNFSRVTFSDVAIADQTGMQDIYAQIGENDPIKLEQTIDLGQPATP